jgi:hypothetical protein
LKSLIRKILRKLRLLGQQNGQEGRIRKDVKIISIQPNLEFIVYWKVLKIGKGPALILKAHGKEVLKFDCFGRGDGHYHVAPNYAERIFFEEQTASAQIERTSKELKDKAQFYLENQKEEHIRTIKIDQEKLIHAIGLAKSQMIYFLESIPEMEDLQ